MMSEHEQKKDPWADLAESLGAKPSAKSSEEPAARPAAATPPPARPPQKPRVDRPATPAARSDWGDLASSLGLEPARETPSSQSPRPQTSSPLPPAAQPPRAAVEPPQRRSDREQDEFSFGSRRPAAEPAPQRDREPARSPRYDVTEPAGVSRPAGGPSEADARDRSDSGAAPRGARDDEQGEGRGRRRRGRRGGRGRGRREEGRDRPLPGRIDDEHASSRWPADTEDLDAVDEPRDGRQDVHVERAGERREPVGDDDGGPRQESAGDADRDADGAPRRRRRRGRRGGRRRGRGEREGEVGVRPQSDRDGGEPQRDGSEGTARFADHNADDDEPLPVGYGGRSPARQAGDTGRGETSRQESRAESRPESRQEGGESSGTNRSDDREPGESGGRRRRRRRRGEGRSRDARGTTAPAEGGREASGSRRSTEASGRRGRRGRRSAGDERRSASTFDRGRRDEFAPVAGGREEDDEGLEFLGVEDASHDAHGRDDRHPMDDDDSIVESGLNEVLDVPSWVEAIGIVIAGNLDARSRSPRSGDSGRGGEPRGESSGRGGSSDRSRDARRGGRSGGSQR